MCQSENSALQSLLQSPRPHYVIQNNNNLDKTQTNTSSEIIMTYLGCLACKILIQFSLKLIVFIFVRNLKLMFQVPIGRFSPVPGAWVLAPVPTPPDVACLSGPVPSLLALIILLKETAQTLGTVLMPGPCFPPCTGSLKALS